MNFSKPWIRIATVVVWLAFTMSFAVWWYTLSSQHIQRLGELEPDRVEHWRRQSRMILWEGTAWIVLLGLGGGALIILVQNERLRVRRIREFFASFSHEIKTSLASLRLQAETLKDERPEPSPVLDRLIGDTVRLQVQLENSLFFASQDTLKLFVEPVRLSHLVERMREQWPGLKIELKGDAILRGDDRALRTILGNLLQNSTVHGRASLVQISAVKASDFVRVQVNDDGAGFDGNVVNLGEAFHRPTPRSGSGLGLYISRLLAQKMGGRLELAPSSGSGFAVRIEIPGEVA